MANEILVSVANVVLRDPTTKAGIAYGKFNISSAFNITMSNTDVRAGIDAPKIFSYYHSREVAISIKQAVFTETIMALNLGQTVSTGAKTVLQTDCVDLSASGSGVITLTPIGNVEVFFSDGSIQTITPIVKNITVSGAVSQSVMAVYSTSKTADQITMETTTPPSIVDLTLIAEIRSSGQSTPTKYLQINVPRFQVAGNYTLDMAMDGVSNETLDGTALESTSSDCATSGYYAKITFIPVTATTTYSSIAAIPATIAWTKSTAQSSQINVLGIRGGVYANTNITTDCTFARSGSSGSGITVGASTGLISTSASSTTIAETVRINATYPSGSLVDYVMINIT
jgi:hypothetical protein